MHANGPSMPDIVRSMNANGPSMDDIGPSVTVVQLVAATSPRPSDVEPFRRLSRRTALAIAAIRSNVDRIHSHRSPYCHRS